LLERFEALVRTEAREVLVMKHTVLMENTCNWHRCLW